MDWLGLTRRRGRAPGPQWSRSRLRRYFEPRLPGTACEISPHAFSAVQLEPRRARWVDSFAVETLPSGLFAPSLTQPGVSSIQELGKVIKAALFRAGINSHRISLAIPDVCARVGIHAFETLSSKQEEKTELLKWKLKKTLPYDIEESHLRFVEQPMESDRVFVITVNIQKDILAQFEEVFESLGIHVGFITLSTLAVFELLARRHQEEMRKSALFLRMSPSGVSSLIVQQGTVVFYRHAGFDPLKQDGDLTGPVDPYDEVHRCLMYAQDKLGATAVDRVYLTYPEALPSEALLSLTERSGASVSNFDPCRDFHWKMAAPSKALQGPLAPALGLASGKF